jgi:hypothetical protein
LETWIKLTKIDNLEKEIISRNPTPVETRNAFAKFISLFSKTNWLLGRQRGPYDVMGNEAKKEEYVLRQDDVDSS